MSATERSNIRIQPPATRRESNRERRGAAADPERYAYMRQRIGFDPVGLNGP
jgi:hypothetical protein